MVFCLPYNYLFIIIEFGSGVKAGNSEHIGYLPLFFGWNQSIAISTMVEITFAWETSDNFVSYGASLLYRYFIENMRHAFGVAQRFAWTVEWSWGLVGQLIHIGCIYHIDGLGLRIFALFKQFCCDSSQASVCFRASVFTGKAMSIALGYVFL